MSRVPLASIPSLTFYKDSLTSSRRTDPIPQLICIGKACNLYTPDVVRCVNLGGAGTEVDWKCEADLPEALRFGRVEVSCEGWSGPGDPHVLKGSCSLQYRIVEVPKVLRSENSHSPRGRLQRWSQTTDIAGLIFSIVWAAFLVVILYSTLRSCLRRPDPSRRQTPSTHLSRPSRWFQGDDRPDGDWGNPPPPYNKQPHPREAWEPGFWTGAALGGLGASFLNSHHRNTANVEPWDWEQERSGRTSGRMGPAWARPSWDNRGEGPSQSNLGEIRRSTGLGGSNVR